MRHLKYRKAYRNILFKIFRCSKLANWGFSILTNSN
jgi:hypothetical protein